MKLYVIGNGFDVHHGLDTKYTSFVRILMTLITDSHQL
ncbi:bacteriophage abortive infection AbiH family protein [Pseudoalteromonas sp. SG44-1]|nr:bacteriophage abortive infection AbiH family protein [Pseudoalteromonas sp. SG44-1]